MAHVRITYEIVTPESAEYGEAAERGFWMPGGWAYPMPEDHDSAGHKAWLADDFRICYDNDGEYDGEVATAEGALKAQRSIAIAIARAAYHDGFRVEEGTDWLVWGGGSDDWSETVYGEQGIESRGLHKCDDITAADWALIRGWVESGSFPEE